MRRALGAAMLAILIVSAACGDDANEEAAPTSTIPIEPSATPTVPALEARPTLARDIGPEARWGLPQGITSSLFQCRPSELDCVAEVMRLHGASQEAIDFFAATGWFLATHREEGVVDIASVYTPWRANSNFDWVLVNGEPPIVFGEDVGNELRPDASNPTYVALRDAHPAIVIWPADEGFEAMDAFEGGQSFVFQYSLNDGCHACGTGYYWRVAVNFDAAGAYQGAQLLDICMRASAEPVTGSDASACPIAS